MTVLLVFVTLELLLVPITLEEALPDLFEYLLSLLLKFDKCFPLYEVLFVFLDAMVPEELQEVLLYLQFGLFYALALLWGKVLVPVLGHVSLLVVHEVS